MLKPMSESVSLKQSLVDIFEAIWPEIVEIYEQINVMVMTEHFNDEDNPKPVSSWAFKRISLTRYMLASLLMGSFEKIITEAKFQMSQEDMEIKDSDSDDHWASTSKVMLDLPETINYYYFRQYS